MGPLLAIIADTWRQSRQQVVFLIMLGALALTVLVSVALTHTIEGHEPDGTIVEKVAVHGIDDEGQLLTSAWMGLYSSTLMRELETDDLDPFSEEGQRMQEELMKIAELQAQTSAKQRGVEVLIYALGFAIYAISMLLFIAASAGYFPALLEAGAIDIVLAKPLERWRIFFGKYLGGMALFGAALFGAYALLFFGLGLRTGIWHPAIFRVMPLQLLSAATLFGLIALLGVLRGSTALAMIVGYIGYVLVDKIMRVLLFVPFGSDRWQSTQELLRTVIPNFAQVRETALLSVINAPATDWQPVFVMLAWLLLSLGLGYWVFYRRDY
ncbi:MAG TPA: ABC transporter permease subunit [Enhygromyxa sp.]|nr:ABC transporter permease subunit [Enhygromyxa sp.]